jgi:hypothetical protein
MAGSTESESSMPWVKAAVRMSIASCIDRRGTSPNCSGWTSDGSTVRSLALSTLAQILWSALSSAIGRYTRGSDEEPAFLRGQMTAVLAEARVPPLANRR